ncbi:MAG: ankyrin repeat domain-containing protein [Candidatus Algichlamydia australiensis]|nr:ankyrin repeat domain-containing protein [Chlamydiales bacterium]
MSTIGFTPQQVVDQNFYGTCPKVDIFDLAKRLDFFAYFSFSNFSQEEVNEKSVRGLTPLHVAVITENFPAVGELLKRGADPTAQDNEGWTPKHHAALIEDSAILNLLLPKGGNEVKNKNGGTWKDLRELAFPENQEPPEDQNVFYYELEGRVVPGTAKKFQELTGAKFAHQMLANPGFFNHQWRQVKEEHSLSNLCLKIHDRTHPVVLEKYKKFMQKPPNLYLKKTRAGYGVFANEEIPSGSIALTYFGRALIEENSSDYRMDLCDGKEEGNLGTRVNDGQPNVTPLFLKNFAGLPSLRLFYTIKKIFPGEQLLFSYGEGHTVKYERYINIAGIKAAIKEYRDESLKEKISLYKKFYDERNEIELQGQMATLDYLFSSPLLQLKLLLKGVLTINVLKSAEKEIKCISYEDAVRLSSSIAKNVSKACAMAPDPQAAKSSFTSFFEDLSVELPQNFALGCFDKIVRNHLKILNIPGIPFNQMCFSKMMLRSFCEEVIHDFIREKFTPKEEEKLISSEYALRRAAFQGDLYSVTFLIEKGHVENPYSKDPKSGKTALDLAIKKGHTKIIEYLRGGG